MNSIAAAIVSKAAGSAFLTSIGSRLRRGRAEQNEIYPYCVFLLPVNGDPLSLSTFTEDIDDIMMQFSIFSSLHASSEAWTIYENLKSLYDGCTLTITGKTLLKMELAAIPPEMAEDHTVSGETVRVWHLPTEYRLVVQN